MKSFRRLFKYALRKCKRNYKCHQVNALVLALHSKSNAPKSFWSKIRSSNNPCSLPAFIGKIKGAKVLQICGKSIFLLS